MLQVCESVVLILEVWIHVDYVSQRCSIKLLHRNTGLHNWPLVVKEKLKLILVLLIVFSHPKGKAQAWLVLVPPVARLTDILIDFLF